MMRGASLRFLALRITSKLCAALIGFHGFSERKKTSSHSMSYEQK